MSNPLLLTCAPHWSDDRVARWGDSYAGSADLLGGWYSATSENHFMVAHPAEFGCLIVRSGDGHGNGTLGYYGEFAYANGYD